ncbi:zinc finger protein 62 homolog [Malaya genurostris]|uniref:zinc finger protein 62 homolog n=1 Tax=Malaya genurostris TaxID=325434 RepID=UPI0026F3A5A7|nr:zinc finger protein 62 homolog [Malaya genurostris]
MSEQLLKSLVDNDFQVCRFCLQSNMEELFDIYEKMPGNIDIISIHTTVRNVLSLFDIQVARNDTYPNFICRQCRDLLFSIQKFRESVKKSAQNLAQAKLLREFPNLKFVESSDCKYLQKNVNIELVERDVLLEQNEGKFSEEIFIDDENDAAFMTSKITQNFKEENKNDLVELSENEYTDTEWIMYEEINIPTEQEGTEAIYLDESQHGIESSIDSMSTEVALDLKNERPNVSKSASKHHTAPKICPVCGITSTAMVVHMRTHSKFRPYSCESCSKCFYTSNKLRCHIKTAHTGERNFQCEICQKAFKLKKTLNTHMMSHISKKSHVCSVCKKCFLFRWALAKHARTHTGEKPFVCDLDGCGKSFVSSSNLRQHQKTGAHLRLPWKDACDECGKLFQSKYALRTHRKVHELTGNTKKSDGLVNVVTIIASV